MAQNGANHLGPRQEVKLMGITVPMPIGRENPVTIRLAFTRFLERRKEVQVVDLLLLEEPR